MLEFRTNRELFEICQIGSQLEKDALDLVELDGWVRTNRNSGTIGFIEFNDGTYFKNVQIVYDKSLENFEEVAKWGTGSAINVVGKFNFTPTLKQPFEIKASKLSLVGGVDEDYPLQKKRHSFEFLREIAHLRPRTNTFGAVFRVRSVLSMAIHEFFQSQGFIYVHTPIITSNDAEGAGEEFTVTTRHDDQYEKDFFGKKAALTVSGQLNAEAFALAFRDVYTFGPTFRAENSNTVRHASEFWMVEPEIAFADLDDDMDLIEDCLKYCISYVLENCPLEMEFFNKMIDKDLLTRLDNILKTPFQKLTYTEGIEILKKAVKDGYKFEVTEIKWGMDLQSEHERYLCEVYANGPLFLIDYPKDIKAFYMRLNDDGKTVAACDLLVPRIGEILGGSQREDRYDYLVKRMQELDMHTEDLKWYADLRRYGGVPHAGFGIGFERFLMYITGMQNIRDVLPYPRTPNNLDF
ncbi:MAG: asparagine--tRNA ligase [Bacilli bacterium]|jgi:asparaginyl-tRNA synthetase